MDGPPDKKKSFACESTERVGGAGGGGGGSVSDDCRCIVNKGEMIAIICQEAKDETLTQDR